MKVITRNGKVLPVDESCLDKNDSYEFVQKVTLVDDRVFLKKFGLQHAKRKRINTILDQKN